MIFPLFSPRRRDARSGTPSIVRPRSSDQQGQRSVPVVTYGSLGDRRANPDQMTFGSLRRPRTALAMTGLSRQGRAYARSALSRYRAPWPFPGAQSSGPRGAGPLMPMRKVHGLHVLALRAGPGG